MDRHLTPPGHRPFSDRLVSQIVDKHGATFGDERERLHIYEALSALTVLLNHLTPLVGLIVVRVAGPATYVPVFTMVVTPILAQLIVRRYLAAHHVSLAMHTAHMSPLRRYSQGLSYILFLLFAQPVAWSSLHLEWSDAPFIAIPLVVVLIVWRRAHKAEPDEL